MNKWLKIAACALIPGAAFAGPTQEDILNKIDAMQKQIAAQQAEIQTLKSALNEREAGLTDMVQQEVDVAIERGAFAQSKSAGTVSLPSHIDGLKLKGDLRLRYERRVENGDGYETREKSRFRTRLRLGGVWKNADEAWEIGAGVATGGSSGKSTNASWNSSGVWDTGDLRLDYAYAKHTWKDYNTSLTLGQQKNPFTSTWMMYDGDLRPTGATVHYANDMFFATAGAYNIRSDAAVRDGIDGDADNDTTDADSAGDSSNQSAANMYAAQVGLTLKTEQIKGTLAVGYYHYDNETVEYELTGANADVDYAYQIGQIYGDVSGKFGEVGVKVFAEAAMNFGADNDAGQGGYAKPSASYEPEDEDLAWIAGVEAKFAGVKLKYAYAHIEGDAIPWFVSDSDFGAAIPGSDNSVNVEGHKIGASYSITKHCSVGATVILTELIEGAAKYDDGELYQFDLKYKF